MAASDDRAATENFVAELAEGEDEYQSATISVWWDMSQCRIPEDGSCDVRSVVNRIMSALVGLSYGGHVAMFAYGDEESVAEAVRGELSEAGVKFRGVESSGACTRILEDMLFWAMDNPAPANYLLLSGDCDFSYALNRLALKRYNILLAQPEDASTCLIATAKSVWLWTSILAGGPSLDNGEVFQYCNNTRECCLNRTRSSPSESETENEQINQSVAFPFESGNGELSRNGSSDDNQSNVSNCSDGKVVMQAEADDGTHPSPFFIAPHEFFRFPKSGSSSSGSVVCPTHSSPDSQSSGNELVNVHNLHSDFPSDEIFHGLTRPNSAPDSVFRSDSPTYPKCPMSDGPTATLTDKDIFNIEHQEIFQENSYSEEFPYSAYPIQGLCSSAGWLASGLPGPPAHVQGLIGIILLALHTLKTEKIIPTEDNIADCIRCGNLTQQKIDVRTALDYSIEHGMVVSRNLGALVIYTGAKSAIWQCVNPLGGDQKDFPKAIWGKLQKFLSSPDGQYKMKISSTRYEAATYLRRACLKKLCLGEVLQVLNMIVEVEKWITVHQSGWQPIDILLAVVTSEDDYQRCGAY